MEQRCGKGSSNVKVIKELPCRQTQMVEVGSCFCTNWTVSRPRFEGKVSERITRTWKITPILGGQTKLTVHDLLVIDL